MDLTSRLANTATTTDTTGGGLPPDGEHTATVMAARVQEKFDRLVLTVEYHTDEGNINQDIPVETSGARSTDAAERLGNFIAWQLKAIGLTSGNAADLGDHTTIDNQIINSRTLIRVDREDYTTKDGETKQRVKATALKHLGREASGVDMLREQFDAVEVKNVEDLDEVF